MKLTFLYLDIAILPLRKLINGIEHAMPKLEILSTLFVYMHAIIIKRVFFSTYIFK